MVRIIRSQRLRPVGSNVTRVSNLGLDALDVVNLRVGGLNSPEAGLDRDRPPPPTNTSHEQPDGHAQTPPQ